MQTHRSCPARPPPGSAGEGRCAAGDAQGFLAVEGKSCLTLHALCVAADSVTGCPATTINLAQC